MSETKATTAPAKAHREPASTAAIACPSCGGPLTLRGFGAIEQVTCSYCGSTLRPDDNDGLSLVTEANRRRWPSNIELYERCRLEGVEWEVLGILWRSSQPGDEESTWQEFLLFNPYRGYQWLIYSPSEGAYSLAVPMSGLPDFVAKKAKYQGKSYRFFWGYPAIVVYVEGEFPWQIRVGDRSECDDFVLGSSSLGIEYAFDEGGEVEDIAASSTRWIDASDVYAAFGKAPSDAPMVQGSPMLEPNPYTTSWKRMRLAAPVLIFIWFFSGVIGEALTKKQTVIEGEGEYLSSSSLQEIKNHDIEIKGHFFLPTELTLEFGVYGLDKDRWTRAKFQFAPVDGGDSRYGFVNATNWELPTLTHQGNFLAVPASVDYTSIPSGKYHLQVSFQSDPMQTRDRKLRYRYAVIERPQSNVGLYLLTGLFIIGIPAWHFIRRSSFDFKKWSMTFDLSGSTLRDRPWLS